MIFASQADSALISETFDAFKSEIGLFFLFFFFKLKYKAFLRHYCCLAFDLFCETGWLVNPRLAESGSFVLFLSFSLIYRPKVDGIASSATALSYALQFVVAAAQDDVLKPS